MKIIKSVRDHVFPSGLVFFDIETTGLSPRTSSLYLIGAMRNEEEKCVLTQFFADAQSEEKQLLEAFVSYLSPEETLVHFNGTTFDIPYLDHKFKVHGIDHYINPDKTEDLYREIAHYKKYLPLENLKLKTVEAAAGFKRSDTYEGAELIKLYANFIGRVRLASITKKTEDTENAESILKSILLHNSDDLEGLLAVYKKTNIGAALTGNFDFHTDITPFDLTISVNTPLFPAEFEFEHSLYTLSNGKKSCELIVHVKEGPLKYFFQDYKNYTYVIDKDMCMHNSVVSGIAKENKKKCTKETAYIKKPGRFIPLPKALADVAAEKGFKLFKEEYNDKTFYIEINEDHEFLKEYAICLLRG
ncbi:MAG: ribonuclease H-like domain-containing protein [Lachnospiraceae bacterium]|nr:ribonuclease H-like domain-containing protein [Lachnospiraceae bacterium]